MKANLLRINFLSSVALLIFFCLVSPEVSLAKILIWQGFIPSDGREVGPIRLTPGETYSVSVEGNFYMGKWWKNGQSIINDPCYEFSAHGQPSPIPVLRNNLGVNWCSYYTPSHEYKSAPFVSDGRPLWFRIFDSDYRDNQGGLQAVVYQHQTAKQEEICGDGIDNNHNNKIDEGCHFHREIIVYDNKCKDDIIGIIINGYELGVTPAGNSRHFDVSQLNPGKHRLTVVGVRSYGKSKGCSQNKDITYGITLGKQMKFIQGGNKKSRTVTEGNVHNYEIMVKY